MSKKKLNTTDVFSELTDQSAFFKRETSPSPKEINQSDESERPSERTTVRPFERSTERFPQPEPKNPKRITRRYSFEAYDDQVKELKRISMQAGIEGKNIPISAMIRDAVDAFLQKHREEGNES